MNEPLLTDLQVVQLIKKAGIGNGWTEKVENIASRTHISTRTLFRYIDSGSKKGAGNFFLLQLAYEYQILERPADSGAAFIL